MPLNAEKRHISSYFIPLAVFLAIVIFLWRGLSMDPHIIPSMLINKPAPSFTMPSLADPNLILTKKDLIGKTSLLNVWSTWCSSCREEHDVLLAIAATKKVVIYGLDYKDDRAKAKQLLKQLGNPYHAVIFDAKGKMALDWGVYGTPETFLIDANGIVRYKHVGPLTMKIWQYEFEPLLNEAKSTKNPSR